MKQPDPKLIIIDEQITREACTHFVRHIIINHRKKAKLPTLVFLHDALGSIPQWKDFPEKVALACQLNAVLIERQGHGKSSPFTEKRRKDYLHQEAWTVLPQILKILAIQNSILIGHSDGGSIALLYGSKFPVQGIISIAAHLFVEPITTQSIQENLKQEAILKAKLSKYHGEKTEALVRAWADTWLAEDFINFNIEADVSSICSPIFIIQSRDDEYGTEKQVNSIFKQIQSTRKEVLWIDHGGHLPHITKTDLLVGKISRFIQGNISKF